MTCAEARPLLGAHLDHELDVRSSLELEAHLRDCAACRAELADLRTLQEAARANLERFTPTAALEARLANAVRPARRARPAWWAAGGAFVAAAAALLLFFVARPGGRRLADEVADAHARSLLVDHLYDVESTDKHTVKPWFNGKLPFGVPVADFKEAGFPLVGGRLDYLNGREVAAIVYGHRKHFINVFVWPDPGEAAPSEASDRGYAMLHFAHGGFAWWLITDANLDDLRDLQKLIAAE